MKSLKYKLFGSPSNSREVIDKLLQSNPKRIKIVLEQIPPGSIKVKLNARYEVTTKINGSVVFDQTISNFYRLDALYMGNIYEFKKAIKCLKNQKNILNNKGVKVSVYVPILKRYLSDKEFDILLKKK